MGEPDACRAGTGALSIMPGEPVCPAGLCFLTGKMSRQDHVTEECLRLFLTIKFSDLM